MSTYEKRQSNRWQLFLGTVIGMALMKHTPHLLGGWIPGIYLLLMLLVIVVAWTEHKTEKDK